MYTSSVYEPLAGLLPAAGGAPHLLALHSVYLAALLGFPSWLPGEEEEEGSPLGQRLASAKLIHIPYDRHVTRKDSQISG